MPPVEYWKRQCFCSVEVGEWSLPGVIATIGDDNLVVSSDFPHFDCEFPHTTEHLVDASGLSERVIAKVGRENPARLYRL